MYFCNQNTTWNVIFKLSLNVEISSCLNISTVQQRYSTTFSPESCTLKRHLERRLLSPLLHLSVFRALPPTFLHTSHSIAVSFCLSSSVVLMLLCCDRFHKGFSLCNTVCPSLCPSPFVSLFLWCHSILTLLSWLCADLPLPLWVSVHLSVSPSALPCLDVFRMWQKSCEPLYLFILVVFLSPADVFPSEWCWKWKSCTSQRSRGWTSCTCEHRTSGDAVTSCLLSVLLFSADISQIF